MPVIPPAEPHEVLGIPIDADRATIKRAYRRLVRLTHPDHDGSDGLFRAVQGAYESMLGRAHEASSPAPSENRAGATRAHSPKDDEEERRKQQEREAADADRRKRAAEAAEQAAEEARRNAEEAKRRDEAAAAAAAKAAADAARAEALLRAREHSFASFAPTVSEARAAFLGMRRLSAAADAVATVRLEQLGKDLRRARWVSLLLLIAVVAVPLVHPVQDEVSHWNDPAGGVVTATWALAWCVDLALVGIAVAVLVVGLVMRLRWLHQIVATAALRAPYAGPARDRIAWIEAMELRWVAPRDRAT